MKNEILLHHETLFRLSIFFAVLLSMAVWEWRHPRRPSALTRLQRWPGNLGIIAVDSLVLRLTMPVMAVGAALEAGREGWGLFNWAAVPFVPACIASLLLLDLIIYAQHVLFHHVALLWRLHRVHHTDTHIDVTTAVRFHPFEIILSMIIKIAAVMLIGAPAAVVVLFEVILNASSMFNHGNVVMPESLDRVLRIGIVTPNMHRVHHSIHRDETDSNFGFSLSLWDRLFGTYRPEPRDGHTGMNIGLTIFRDRRSLGLHWLLVQPFLKSKNDE